ncbi:hypothetical protein GB928_018620 [Shinella curvata]|uniref:Uncharacterized protein n=1 Tax=Shinella curvata TaxID=1817964 RepID=A0ABT8XHJ0_9HYPH|nr:hypothetical protein [Shinella curvata]MCJ8053874.1 hypothetical protein [Shinella curvata]MDO6123206.1 hypothetical protein [Shinella curvata]
MTPVEEFRKFVAIHRESGKRQADQFFAENGEALATADAIEVENLTTTAVGQIILGLDMFFEEKGLAKNRAINDCLKRATVAGFLLRLAALYTADGGEVGHA